MIHLLIKGDINAAFKAADARCIELTSLAYRVETRDCVASTTSECIEKVQAWFTAPAELIMGVGYPDGTLLHYSHK